MTVLMKYLQCEERKNSEKKYEKKASSPQYSALKSAILGASKV